MCNTPLNVLFFSSFTPWWCGVRMMQTKQEWHWHCHSLKREANTHLGLEGKILMIMIDELLGWRIVWRKCKGFTCPLFLPSEMCLALSVSPRRQNLEDISLDNSGPTPHLRCFPTWTPADVRIIGCGRAPGLSFTYEECSRGLFESNEGWRLGRRAGNDERIPLRKCLQHINTGVICKTALESTCISKLTKCSTFNTCIFHPEIFVFFCSHAHGVLEAFRRTFRRVYRVQKVV